MINFNNSLNLILFYWKIIKTHRPNGFWFFLIYFKISNAKRSMFAHEKDINAIRFSPNEKLIASASQDRLIKVIFNDVDLN